MLLEDMFFILQVYAVSLKLFLFSFAVNRNILYGFIILYSIFVKGTSPGWQELMLQADISNKYQPHSKVEYLSANPL